MQAAFVTGNHVVGLQFFTGVFICKPAGIPEKAHNHPYDGNSEKEK